MKKQTFAISVNGKQTVASETVSGYIFQAAIGGVIYQFGVDNRGVGKPAWQVTEIGTGKSVAVGFGTRNEAIEFVLGDDFAGKFEKYVGDGSGFYEASVKAFSEVVERGSMPKDEYRSLMQKLKSEFADKADETAAEDEQAVEISLEAMRKWCESHPNTAATQVRDGACVKVHGVMREDTEWQRELKELGYRYSKKGFWWAKPTA